MCFLCCVCSLVEAAKEIITESLPIKCLEAVILGLYLTIPLETVERFPLSFHSHFLRRTYRHVVLGVYHAGRYGALGMSRRQDLMYKELKYKVICCLVIIYKKNVINIGVRFVANYMYLQSILKLDLFFRAYQSLLWILLTRTRNVSVCVFL